MAAGPRGLTQYVAPLGLFLGGMAVAFWPMLRSGFALMQVDPADTRIINFSLEWAHRWLTTSGLSLWSPPFFHPVQGVSAFTESMLGVAPFYSAWRLAGLAPDSAFQAWMMTMATLNAVAGWLLFRRALGFPVGAAAVGAFFLCFAGVRLNQANHQHLLAFFPTFIALIGLVRLMGGAPRPRSWLAVVGAGVVLQVYASIQLGWFLVFVLGLALVWALVLPASRAQVVELARAQWRPLLACGLLAALALLPLGLAYRAAGQAVGFRTFAEARAMLPQAQSWLYQGPHNWLAGRLAGLHLFTQLPMEGEHRIGLGLLTTAVTAWTLWRLRRRPWWAVLALTTVSVLALTTVHGRFSPWQLVMAVVPGANGIRAVARIAAFLVVPGALALATLVQERRRWPALAVVAVCLAEQGQAVPDSYDKQGQRDEVATVVRAVPPGCGAFFWAPREAPPFDEKTQLDAMWAALEVGVPTVNGCSGNTPRGWDLMQHSLVTEGDEPRLRAALARWEQDRGLAPGSVCFVTP